MFGCKAVGIRMRDHTKLRAFELADEIVLLIYQLTKKFPNDELYGLTSQMRRAAISVPSNIAEGYGRKTIPDYVRCLYIAYGSTCELETQTLLSGNLKYLNDNKKSHSWKK